MVSDRAADFAYGLSAVLKSKSSACASVQVRLASVRECPRPPYRSSANVRVGCVEFVSFPDAGGMRPVIDVQRVDYIRIPVTDMEKANQFYGEVLGLERNPNSRAEDWVEYEAGNVTLAVMTPHTHDYEFAPLPVGTLALRVPDVADAKAKLEAAGVQVNEMWDSGVCHGAGVRDPAGNPILLHHRYAPYGPR
jgi:catechol 2,3-dioxygenase-like lactoylglutathione lyase family enzyme